MKIGDIVRVRPKARALFDVCTGTRRTSGLGVLTRVGVTLVRVQFPNPKTKAERDGVACFREDCEVG